MTRVKNEWRSLHERVLRFSRGCCDERMWIRKGRAAVSVSVLKWRVQRVRRNRFALRSEISVVAFHSYVARTASLGSGELDD